MRLFDLDSYESRTGCSGCGACVDACPVDAIVLQEDAEGFVYPRIDPDRCTQCGLCDRVCPMPNLPPMSRADSVSACWAKEKDIRRDSSSGGIFSLLAGLVIRQGGVVFGAAFDEHMHLRHVGVERLEDLPPLRRSKYVQSDAEGVYAEVKGALRSGRKVLFVGTPCQVAALSNYLRKPYDNLLKVDFVCHGVPSAKMFSDYLAWQGKREGGRISDFRFRVKDGPVKHVHGYAYRCDKAGGAKERRGLFIGNPYYYGFKRYIFLRPSCYACPYAVPERSSDITLADFWGVEDYLPEVDFDKGVSMVLANTPAGKEAFAAVAGAMERSVLDFDVAVRCNHNLSRPTSRPAAREAVMRDYRELPFGEFVSKHLKPKTLYAAAYKIYFSLPHRVRKCLSKYLRKFNYV